MNDTVFSILLVVIGLIVGIIVTFIINKLRGVSAKAEANKLIERATRDAEKAKRDGLLELKEESYKIKQQTD